MGKIRRAHGAPDSAAEGEMDRFVFPRWTNYLLPILIVAVAGGAVYVPLVLALGASPETINVGYRPTQPVPYSHALHVGQLGMDCRYCHNTVEKAAFAALPPTQTCMNCHTKIKADSPKLQPVRDSYVTGQPIPWVKVHDLPDYVYFNHSAHVSKGVSCVSCHGRVDKMETVYQAKPLNMAWCLECHRNPAPNLRPLEYITQLDWQPTEDPVAMGKELMKKYNVRDPEYMTGCYVCHR